MARFASRDGWELWEYCPKRKRSIWRAPDGAGGYHWQIAQDVEETLKANAEHRASEAGRNWGDGRRIASIPLNLFYDQKLGLNEAAVNGDDAYISKWLNDGDNAAFRTREGRV